MNELGASCVGCIDDVDDDRCYLGRPGLLTFH